MKIFLVRHGETDYAKKGFTTGHQDIPLNDVGREHAQKTAAFLKDKGISKVYSSSLSRASETAKIIARELSLEVIESDILREHTSGRLDGVPLKEFFAELERVGDFDKMVIQAGGEHPDDFRERVRLKFFEIVENEKESGNILIVTHSEVQKEILSGIFKTSYLNSLLQGSCCVNIIDYDSERKEGHRYFVELINYTYHLS